MKSIKQQTIKQIQFKCQFSRRNVKRQSAILIKLIGAFSRVVQGCRFGCIDVSLFPCYIIRKWVRSVNFRSRFRMRVGHWGVVIDFSPSLRQSPVTPVPSAKNSYTALRVTKNSILLFKIPFKTHPFELFNKIRSKIC